MHYTIYILNIKKGRQNYLTESDLYSRILFISKLKLENLFRNAEKIDFIFGPYLNYGFRNIRKRKSRNRKLRNFRNYFFRNLGVSMLNYGIEHGISIIP